MRIGVPVVLLVVCLGLAAPAPAQSGPAQTQPDPEGPPMPGAPVRVGDAELSVALSPGRPTVGDRVTALLTLTAPAKAAGEPRFPDWQGSWGTAEVVSFTEPERLTDRNGLATWRQRVELVTFRPGAVVLPPVAVELPLAGAAGGAVTLSSPAGLGFKVASVLPNPDDPASTESPESPEDPTAPLRPRPPEAPRELPLGAMFWAVAGSLAALTLGLLWMLWKSRLPDAQEAPPLAPLAELEAALATCPGQPSAEAAHARLSAALRRYLGRRLGFSALESTTTEIRRRLHRVVLPPAPVDGVLSVLAACDGVKFDRRDPLRGGRPDTDDTLARRLDLAARSATALERHLRPPEPEDAPAPRREAAL